MLTKMLRTSGGAHLVSYWLRSVSVQQRVPAQQLHGWNGQNTVKERHRKTIPKLVYLHNPWKYLITKMNLMKLKWLWDHDFSESEFIEGSKQAAVVMTNIIREQNSEQIGQYTTPVGFQQIARDMLLSRNDTRLQLVRFETEHLRRAIPMKVATRKHLGRKYAFIDMLFVGLRNTKDFDTPAELLQISDIIRRMDIELKTSQEILSVPHRIVFAEIFIRFRREYSDVSRRVSKAPIQHRTGHTSGDNEQSNASEQPGTRPMVSRPNDGSWSVSFYKILTFDVLNYDPNHKP